MPFRDQSMRLIKENGSAIQFDEKIESFMQNFQGTDETVMLITVGLLTQALIKTQTHWPEDILGFADYVCHKLDDLDQSQYSEKLPEAKAHLDYFLNHSNGMPEAAVITTGE